MAFIVGMFQGAIQALSRSYYAQIIPADSSGEYFGLYDICGKGAAFMGTTLVGLTVSITNSVNVAVATLGILFVLGFIFLRKSSSLKA
jgi:UMF1 family MFS transporter